MSETIFEKTELHKIKFLDTPFWSSSFIDN